MLVNPIGKPFIQLSETESSNNYAMAKVQAQMAEHGFTVFALSQTHGKGQRGKSWKAEPGQNIILTTVIEPKVLTIQEGFYLSAAVALACYDFFSAYAGDDTRIKWPNDLYWKDRKAGGILIENILKGSDWRYAIVGIGININQTTFPNDIPNPVSLKQITGKTFDPKVLAEQLCEKLEYRWQQLLQGDAEKLLELYNSILYKLHETATFKKGYNTLKMVVEGVNKNGELLVSGGVEDRLTYGDYEWILRPR